MTRSTYMGGGGFVTVSYQGPGDIVSGAQAWWGLRAYSNATIGANAVRLRRDSDNGEQDFVTLTDGSLDVANIATFKGAANLFVVKLYDQTGNGFPVTQPSASGQPAFTLNGLGSLPIITFDSAAGRTAMDDSSALTYTKLLSISCVHHAIDNGGQQTVLGFSNNGPRLGVRNAGVDTLFWYNGTPVNVACTFNAWHSIQGVSTTTASSKIAIDGTITTSDIGSSTGSTPFHYGDNGEPTNGKGVEAGVWFASAFTNTEIANLTANQQAYWGI